MTGMAAIMMVIRVLVMIITITMKILTVGPRKLLILEERPPVIHLLSNITLFVKLFLIVK